MITKQKINKIIQIIAENSKPEKIVVFGSYAFGQPTKESDLDILVVKKSNKPKFKRGKEIRKLLRGIKVPIDLLVYTPDEINKWKKVKEAFITRIINQGKIVYGK